MEIRYKPQVVKQLNKLPFSQKQKVIKKLILLSQDPNAGKMLKGEFEGLYSLRAWPYRIVYEIKEKTIIIYSVTHRQSVYK